MQNPKFKPSVEDFSFNPPLRQAMNHCVHVESRTTMKDF